MIDWEKRAQIPIVQRADFQDSGIACALASLLTCYWDGSQADIASWVINLEHRFWFPCDWDEADPVITITGTPEQIAHAATEALIAIGSGYAPAGAESRYDVSAHEPLTRVARLIVPGENPGTLLWKRSDTCKRPDAIDCSRIYTASLAMRYVWLARGHEVNHRYPADIDWQTARQLAAKLGIVATGEPEVWVPRVLDVIAQSLPAIESCI